MFVKNRYDILLDRPGREVIEEPKPKPPDVSFLSDTEFIEFIQGEIKRREEINNTVFTTQFAQLVGMNSLGMFISREQAEANRLSYAPGVTIPGYEG